MNNTITLTLNKDDARFLRWALIGLIDGVGQSNACDYPVEARRQLAQLQHIVRLIESAGWGA